MFNRINYSDLKLENYARKEFEERILKPFKGNWNEVMYYFRNYAIDDYGDESDASYYDEVCDFYTIDNLEQAFDIYMEDIEFNNLGDKNKYYSNIPYNGFVVDEIVIPAIAKIYGNQEYAEEIITRDLEVGYDDNNGTDEYYKSVDSVIDSLDFGVNETHPLYEVDFIVNLIQRY